MLALPIIILFKFLSAIFWSVDVIRPSFPSVEIIIVQCETQLRVVFLKLYVAVQRQRNLITVILHPIHVVTPRGDIWTSRANEVEFFLSKLKHTLIVHRYHSQLFPFSCMYSLLALDIYALCLDISFMSVDHDKILIPCSLEAIIHHKTDNYPNSFLL